MEVTFIVGVQPEPSMEAIPDTATVSGAKKAHGRPGALREAGQVRYRTAGGCPGHHAGRWSAIGVGATNAIDEGAGCPCKFGDCPTAAVVVPYKQKVTGRLIARLCLCATFQDAIGC